MPFVARKPLLWLPVLAVVVVALLFGFVRSGLYDVGADAPHARPVFALMESLRDHSIHARSKDLAIPDLGDPQRVLEGAGQYAAMCSGCHLAPGMEDSELRRGLYPQPPVLSEVRIDPRDAFWVIKHGVKMSAMPAWGASHDDPTIWSMVAFLQKLPDMSPAQYQDIVARAPADEDMEPGHHRHAEAHGGDEAATGGHRHGESMHPPSPH